MEREGMNGKRPGGELVTRVWVRVPCGRRSRAHDPIDWQGRPGVLCQEEKAVKDSVVMEKDRY